MLQEREKGAGIALFRPLLFTARVLYSEPRKETRDVPPSRRIL